MSVKFFVDFMLGKLARELRMLGFDTEYFKSQDIPMKSPLTLIKIAKEQNRIILTRNTKLKNYPEVFFITSEKIHEQLQLIIQRFKLKKETKPFRRCLACNEILASIEKDKVKGEVPFFVFQTKQDFTSCPKCHKIYWSGTHLTNMKKRVKKIVK